MRTPPWLQNDQRLSLYCLRAVASSFSSSPLPVLPFQTGPAYVYLSKLIISSLFFYSEQSLILEGHPSLFMLSETGLFLH